MKLYTDILSVHIIRSLVNLPRQLLVVETNTIP